jgi:hypothetical protein
VRKAGMGGDLLVAVAKARGSCVVQGLVGDGGGVRRLDRRATRWGRCRGNAGEEGGDDGVGGGKRR